MLLGTQSSLQNLTTNASRIGLEYNHCYHPHPVVHLRRALQGRMDEARRAICTLRLCHCWILLLYLRYYPKISEVVCDVSLPSDTVCRTMLYRTYGMIPLELSSSCIMIALHLFHKHRAILKHQRSATGLADTKVAKLELKLKELAVPWQ